MRNHQHHFSTINRVKEITVEIGGYTTSQIYGGNYEEKSFNLYIDCDIFNRMFRKE